MNARATLSVSALGLALSLPAVAQLPPGYRIVEVTNSQRDERKPKMNNRGQVVFASRIRSDDTSGEIFLYDNGQLIQITNDNVADAMPDLNDDGTIVWSRFMGPLGPNAFPTAEIMMYRNGAITRITDDALDDWSPRINNLDEVVWQRHYEVVACGGYLVDIFMFDGRREIQISTDALTENVENQAPEINDHTQIVWTRYDFCDPPAGVFFESKIMMYSGGTITELTSGQFAPQAPDINNSGQVVWSWFDTATGRYAIDVWEAGVTTALTDDGVIPVINEWGDIAFDRWDTSRGHWDIWLYQSGAFLQITRDDFDNIVPDINDLSEIAWGTPSRSPSNIRYMRRFLNGDLNCDDVFNGGDIDPFFLALGDPSQYSLVFPSCDPMLADMNSDGLLNGADIDAFFNALGGG